MRKLPAVVFLLTGCATMSPERGHDEVARLVQERAGAATGWEKGTPAEDAVAQRVNALLAPGLTRARAVAIGLINNPGLQSTYEELGVSQADLVQAGLLKNPTINGSLGFPLSGGPIEIEFGIVQELVDLITLSWRKDAALQQFKVNTLRVAHEALELVGEVNHAFVTLQANLENEKLLRQTIEGAEGSHLLAEKQFAAGNISELHLANERATWAQLQLELTIAQVQLSEAHERLNRLLGLWGKNARWRVAEALPEVPPADALPDHPEALAVRQRLDLEAARRQAAVWGQAVSLARSTRLFGRVELGGSYKREPQGEQLIGPTLVLELPIFDQRGPYIAGLEAEQRSAERKVSALAINARSKVRDGILALKSTRAMAVFYSSTLVPLRDKIVEQSQLHYNGMLIGLYQLVEARQSSLESRRSAISARRDYWIARFELEHALGGALP